MSTSNGELFDAVVVGAGVAGASAATGLANRGLRVALVDRHARCAPCFRAEKVEPDQADLLRELSLFDGVRSKLTPIRAIASAYRGRVLDVVEIEQYGVDYWEFTNAIQDLVPGSVEQCAKRVVQIDLSGERRRVVLEDGSALESRLAATSRVEAQKIDLYQLSGPPRAGLVAIGDAYQSVCPATGTGISKVLTDAVVLCDHLPGWIATPGRGSEKLVDYYGDPRKRAGDAQSLDWAEHRRNFSTRTDLRWRVHRARTWIEMYARGRRGAPRRGVM